MSLQKPPACLPARLTDCWAILLISLFNSLTHGCGNMGIERNCRPIKVMKASSAEIFPPLENSVLILPPSLSAAPPPLLDI
jgi:hypothetical protein